MMNLYSSKEAAKIAGITYRQLDHWSSSGLVEPDISKAYGKGTRRLFSFRNLVQLRLIKKLNEAGLSIQGLRGVGELLKEEHMPGAPDEAFKDKEYIVVNDNGLITVDLDKVLQELKDELNRLQQDVKPEPEKKVKVKVRSRRPETGQEEKRKRA